MQRGEMQNCKHKTEGTRWKRKGEEKKNTNALSKYRAFWIFDPTWGWLGFQIWKHLYSTILGQDLKFKRVYILALLLYLITWTYKTPRPYEHCYGLKRVVVGMGAWCSMKAKTQDPNPQNCPSAWSLRRVRICQNMTSKMDGCDWISEESKCGLTCIVRKVVST
jgi:hypothetical protein